MKEEKQKRRNITLGDRYVAAAIKLGGGLSEGIRRALAPHMGEPVDPEEVRKLKEAGL